jgi:hypothetical protein
MTFGDGAAIPQSARQIRQGPLPFPHARPADAVPAGTCTGIEEALRPERPPNRSRPDGRPRSVSGAIHYPPSPPVLADGLFMHVTPFDKEQEADAEIPNINCAKCTLQVIEFVAAHGRNRDGDYSYHHCAKLQIRANPDKPIDTRFAAENKTP